jgi:hypothetical protein
MEEKKENEQQYKSLVKLLNPAFTFEFAGNKYEVKRANIEQVQQYQIKVNELGKKTDIPSAVRDLDVVSYATYLILHKNYSDVTEDFVKENLPGNVDVISYLAELGFIDPQKAEMVKKLQEKIVSGSSSQTLSTEQDGLQVK